MYQGGLVMVTADLVVAADLVVMAVVVEQVEQVERVERVERAVVEAMVLILHVYVVDAILMELVQFFQTVVG